MGIPENLHQLKRYPEIYNWFVEFALVYIATNLKEVAEDIKRAQHSRSKLAPQLSSHITTWPQIYCHVPASNYDSSLVEPFDADDYYIFSSLAIALERIPIAGHRVLTLDHRPGRVKFMTVNQEILTASFCIAPAIKSFPVQR